MEQIGLDSLIFDTILGTFLEWWWLIVLVTALAILHKLLGGKRSRRNRKDSFSQKSSREHRAARHKYRSTKVRSRNTSEVITGKAFVTDGDGIRIAGREVRIVGIDAPEWDQRAKHADGRWFNHGKIVKSALIKEIGGKQVRVLPEDTDKFGRLIGAVIFEDRDIGEWLVREGHAIAAYDDRYRIVEREARREKRGMWAHAYNFDPRRHRHR